jgi:putative CocE/NonD family hydrolase
MVGLKASTAVVSLCLAALPAFAKDPINTMVPMPDGTRLMTLVLLPDGQGPFPAIVVRTPYGLPTPPSGPVVLEDDAEADAILATWAPVLERGYAVVQQNTRGRGGSEGLDMLFQTDRADGAALAEWLVDQPWSDGTFRITGDSADGFAGYLMAAERPAGLTGAFFQVSCANLQKLGVVRRTGGLQMEALAPWIIQQAGESGQDNLTDIVERGVDLEKAAGQGEALFGQLFGGEVGALINRPLTEMEPNVALQPFWRDFISEEGYAARAEYFDAAGDIDVPITHVGLWQDTFVDCTIDAFQRASGEQSLIVMNGTHYDIDDAEVWQSSGLENAFLDWLDGNTAAAVRFEVENAPSPMLIETPVWPPAGATAQRLYLSKEGLARLAPSAGELGQVVTDIAAPVATEGGRNLVITAGTEMAALPSEDEEVILQIGEPMAADAILVGPVTLDVTIRPDAQDADIVARLVAFNAEGQPRLILENLARARYRDGRDNPSPTAPGVNVDLRIDLGHTAHYLSAGDQLGLILQGSNLPRWDIATGLDGDPSLDADARRITTVVETNGTARLEFATLATDHRVGQ